MPDFSIGVDLGGTNLRIAAVSDEGQLLEKITLGTNLALGRNHVIDEMCDAMQRLSGKYKETGDFLGAGIGFPGLIDIATGRLRKAVMISRKTALGEVPNRHLPCYTMAYSHALIPV